MEDVICMWWWFAEFCEFLLLMSIGILHSHTQVMYCFTIGKACLCMVILCEMAKINCQKLA